ARQRGNRERIAVEQDYLGAEVLGERDRLVERALRVLREIDGHEDLAYFHDVLWLTPPRRLRMHGWYMGAQRVGRRQGAVLSAIAWRSTASAARCSSPTSTWDGPFARAITRAGSITSPKPSTTRISSS